MRIPAEIVRRFGLRDGDTVDAQLKVDGALTIWPAGWNRHAFAGEFNAARAELPLGANALHLACAEQAGARGVATLDEVMARSAQRIKLKPVVFA